MNVKAEAILTIIMENSKLEAIKAYQKLANVPLRDAKMWADRYGRHGAFDGLAAAKVLNEMRNAAILKAAKEQME